MGGLNWIDAAIIAVVIIFARDGFRSGFLRTIAHIFGLVLGLIIAAGYYHQAGNFLIGRMNIAPGIADIASFLIIFMVIYSAMILAGSLLGLITVFRPLRIINRLGGIVAGCGLGVAFSGAVLLILTTFPFFSNYDLPVKDSRFGSRAVSMVDELYVAAESTLSLQLPKLAFFPDELPFFPGSGDNHGYVVYDFSLLEGATCVACDGPVDFLGYLEAKEGAVSPRLDCRNCGRKSDGCQTYEGHHILYDRCPAVLGRMGYRTDCGMWTNGSFIRVTGDCPVCGESGTAVSASAHREVNHF